MPFQVIRKLFKYCIFQIPFNSLSPRLSTIAKMWRTGLLVILLFEGILGSYGGHGNRNGADHGIHHGGHHGGFRGHHRGPGGQHGLVGGHIGGVGGHHRGAGGHGAGAHHGGFNGFNGGFIANEDYNNGGYDYYDYNDYDNEPFYEEQSYYYK